MFGNFKASNQGQIIRAAAVTPAGADLAGGVTNGLYCGASGNVTVMLSNGATVTFTGLASGVIHPIRAKQVISATATNILACYSE